MERRRTILFVDDDEDMLEIGGIILRKAGYTYVPADSAEVGLEILLTQKPDLIILDYFMPGLNGYEFFQTLVKNVKYHSAKDIPVIMLTAASEQDVERQQLFELGLSAFLQKPFGNRELLNVIENVFILNDLQLENKKLEEQIKRTEYKYQDLIENASDLIFTLDPEARFVFINRRLKQISGFDREKWIGKKCIEIIHKEDIEKSREHLSKAINGKSRIFETRLNLNGSKSIYLSINCNPIFEKGQVVGCVAIARDITEEKMLEQEIVELKNFNESIIQSMGSGLLTINLNNTITSFNNSATEILGYAPDEIVHKRLQDIFPEEDCEKILENVKSPQQGLLNREMPLTAKNGKPIFIGFSVTPRYDTKNHRVGTIISFKDISQIKHMQTEVQRMDRLASMGVLASGIAHEIRNPLAGIKTIAQTLEEEIEHSDHKREYVSRIVRQVNRMDDLLKTIFSYAKPREPKLKYHRLNEIIYEVFALLENRMKKQSIKYQSFFHEELPLIYVDFYQIQQVFINLFLNALDAMPDGGTLQLEAIPKVTTLNRLDRRGRAFPVQNESSLFVDVTLQDSGIGISEENLSSIFNPFFTTKPQGSGLGLSIVYQIVTEHNGDIQVESEHDKGTTFKLLLPTEE